jgi:uncharacterized membrane protein (UPF0127 family)
MDAGEQDGYEIRRSLIQDREAGRHGGWRPGIWVALVILLAWAVPAVAVEVNPLLPTGTVMIAGRVRLTVEVARTPAEQVRGLSGRPSLTPGTGMLFVYDRPQPVSIWMKDMRFPLDILWIRDGRIVQIQKKAPPMPPAGPERIYTATADQVLEVPASFTDRKRIRVGDSVQVTLP